MATKKKQAAAQTDQPTGPKVSLERLRSLKEADMLAMSEDEYVDALQALIEHIPIEEKKGQGNTTKELRQLLDLFDKHPKASGIVGGMQDIRRQDWEINDTRIKGCIRHWLTEYGNMPNVSTIAKELELSRQTVYEHMNAGIGHEFYQERMKQMEHLTADILTQLYRRLLEGNAMAGKIYLDYMLKMQQHRTNINQQNNYIQVNNLVLDEQKIKSLPEDDRLRVTSIGAELRDIVNKYQN